MVQEVREPIVIKAESSANKRNWGSGFLQVKEHQMGARTRLQTEDVTKGRRGPWPRSQRASSTKGGETSLRGNVYMGVEFHQRIGAP